MQIFLPGWNNLKQVETGLDSLIVQAPTSTCPPVGQVGRLQGSCCGSYGPHLSAPDLRGSSETDDPFSRSLELCSDPVLSTWHWVTVLPSCQLSRFLPSTNPVEFVTRRNRTGAGAGWPMQAGRGSHRAPAERSYLRLNSSSNKPAAGVRHSPDAGGQVSLRAEG